MLFKFLAKYRDCGLLLLRLGVGTAFIFHGLPKLTGGPKTWAGLGGAMKYVGLDLFPEFWGFMAAASEGIGGLLLILGVFYRPTCLLLAITMTFATLTLVMPEKRDFKNYSHPLKMAFVFLGLATVGPGRFSIDKD
jgi:putative oxidoreductase